MNYDNWVSLGNAIILRAVKDYRRNARTLKRYGQDNERGKKALEELRDLEAFFSSDYFTQLTNVDPVLLMEELKGGRRMNYDRQRACESNDNLSRGA